MSEPFSIPPENIDAWANLMLDEATDEMVDKEIEITPQSLSTYFEQTRDLSLSPEEAKQWLEEQSWWFTYNQEEERKERK